MNLIKIDTTCTINQSQFTIDELSSLREEIDNILSPNKEPEEKPKSLKDTYFELYDRLPKWIADRAKANWDGKIKEYFSSASDAIMFGFDFESTKEREEFWGGVYDWLIGNQPHPPFPPELEKPREDAVYLGKGGEFQTNESAFNGWSLSAVHCVGLSKWSGNSPDSQYAAPADSEIVKLNYGNPPK